MSILRKVTRYITNYDDTASAGSRFRSKRILPLLHMIKAVYNIRGEVKIIDVGGTCNYWNIVSKQWMLKHNVKITLVNLPSTSVSINSEIFEFVQANGCNLEMFRDKSYHIGHSNSVLEHVGDWDNMVKFSSELCRVSERQFVQTPNYWFPIEPHCMIPFFHWLPKPVRIRLVMAFSLGHWSKAGSVDQAVRIVESARLVNKLMFKELYHGANIITERFMMLPKSFIAINNSTDL
ncbi:class I SAM-dependent methyltransferase [Geobacter sulfurreducens]|uniref:class I SAM-dependent methyltransferase n=1 Tax=Geobacter sulfurreducens TaxID=35554 RepID=UPI000DBB95D3|nr:class I SAM-dependent methyltransferase [Geobacter sulfurreducens]BBA70352.1 hypothetical protein YM18_1830 [Geobacter sulfurreducens]